MHPLRITRSPSPGRSPTRPTRPLPSGARRAPSPNAIALGEPGRNFGLTPSTCSYIRVPLSSGEGPPVHRAWLAEERRRSEVLVRFTRAPGRRRRGFAGAAPSGLRPERCGTGRPGSPRPAAKAAWCFSEAPPARSRPPSARMDPARRRASPRRWSAPGPPPERDTGRRRSKRAAGGRRAAGVL